MQGALGRKHTLEKPHIDGWLSLVRVPQDVLSRVETSLKTAGLPSLAWYDILLEINRVSPDPIRAGALQERLLLRQYNLSRILYRIEKAGLIESRPSKDDGRARDLTITDAGLKRLREMWPVYEAAIKRHFASRLSEREAKQLSTLLSKLQDH